MIQTKQTLVNFFEFIDKTKTEYQKSLDSYGWNFKYNLEELSEMKCFIITNNNQSTKVLYNEPAKMIISINIYDGDIQKIQKLKEGL